MFHLAVVAISILNDGKLFELRTVLHEMMRFLVLHALCAKVQKFSYPKMFPTDTVTIQKRFTDLKKN